MSTTQGTTDVRLEPTDVLVRRERPSIEWVEIEGEAVVWNAEATELHHLDPIATLLFQLCDGVATLGQTVAELAEAFGQPASVIEPDIMECARLLCGHRILAVAR